MAKLTNEEKETIITFDETPADAIVFTYSKRWQRQIEHKLGIKPTMNNGYGGREYIVPKGRLRLPQAKQTLTAEQREKATKRLARLRPKKSIPSVGNRGDRAHRKSEKGVGV